MLAVNGLQKGPQGKKQKGGRKTESQPCLPVGILWEAHASGDTDFLDLGSSPGLGICFFKVESHYIRETVIGIQ